MLTMKHRNRLEIIALILQNAVEANGATQKRIMYKAYLSYHHLKSYLVLLRQNELLFYDEFRRTYKTTEKGERFLNIYYGLNEVVSMTNSIISR
jgi:predicted transcriptional regulator